MKKIIIVIICLLTGITSFGQERVKIDPDHFPLPKVDKRVELLSIVFRLAGNREYNQDIFKDYVKDIHDHLTNIETIL